MQEISFLPRRKDLLQDFQPVLRHRCVYVLQHRPTVLAYTLSHLFLWCGVVLRALIGRSLSFVLHRGREVRSDSGAPANRYVCTVLYRYCVSRFGNGPPSPLHQLVPTSGATQHSRVVIALPTVVVQYMARSFFLLLVLPIAASGWGSTFHPSSSQYSKRASKRSRPVWKSPLDGERSGAERGRSVGMSISSGGDSAGSGSGSGSGLGDSGGKEWVDDGRDSLPFVVYDAAPPPRKVGVANLPPLTGTGDTLWHGAKHYKVLRVSNHYKYEGGRFVVRRKSIQAKELKRVAKERVVARLVYGEGKNSPPPSSS